MRRTSGRTDSLTGSSEGEQGFWPSYADMMSALALILFFLMLLSYIQNLITGNDLQNTQEVLEDTRAQLSLTMSQVDDAKARLDKVTLDLNKASLDLEDAKADLSKAQLDLSAKQDELNAQQVQLDEQAKYLVAANEELVEMRSQMQTIAVLRLSILEKIRDSIVNVMGDPTKVSIGENGSIILSEGVLFDVGSSEIKPNSQPVLDQLSQVFAQFLSSEENVKYVDSIVIAGHTDSTGTDENNRKLSTDRANSVLNYLLIGNKGKLGKYAQFFCAAGYGETRPVADNSTEEGCAANRRIEISIILKDDTVLDIVDDYLRLGLPATDARSMQAVTAASENGGEKKK